MVVDWVELLDAEVEELDELEDDTEIDVFEALVVIEEPVVDVTEVEPVDELALEVELNELDELLEEVDCGELDKLEPVEE